MDIKHRILLKAPSLDLKQSISQGYPTTSGYSLSKSNI